MARLRILSVSDMAAPEFAGLTSEQAREYRGLPLALLLSLLIHALLMSLTFEDAGLGLPGFVFHRVDRRIEAPPLRVMLAPAHAMTAEPAVKAVVEPSRQASIRPHVAAGQAAKPPPSPPLRPRGRAVADVLATTPTAQAEAEQNAAASVLPVEVPTRDTGADLVAHPQVLEFLSRPASTAGVFAMARSA